MRTLAAVVCLGPALFAAKAPSPDAQALIKAVRARNEAFTKALTVHLGAGKPYTSFTFDLQPDIDACAARLKREKRPEMRMALGLALCAYKSMKPVQANTLDPEDLALLKTVPMDSPLWALYPQGPLFLARDFKSPADMSAFLERFTERATVPELRQSLLVNAFYAAHSGGDEAAWKKALARLEKEFPKAKITAEIRSYATVRINVGKPAPAFKVRTLDGNGEVLTLESFKGKYLLMDFWATWCVPCKEAMPTLHKVHAAYKDKGLEMLSVADDKSAEVVQAYRKNPATPMPWHNVVVVFDSKSRTRDNPISEDYGIHQLPTLVLIGPDGKVLADDKALHGDLEAAVARFIGAGAPAVDFAALQKDLEAIAAKVRAAVQAHGEAKKPDPFQVDPAILGPLRERARKATGLLREALLVQEATFAPQLRLESAFKDQVLKEVKPSSEAWRVAPDAAPGLAQIWGDEAKPYVEALRAEGIPQVRAALFASDAYELLAKDPQAALATVAKAKALDPESQTVKMVEKMVQGELKTAIGSMAPAFRIENLEDPGKTYTLADFKGKYLLVDFWGTWCGWCVKELPTTHKVYAKFKDKGFEILSVAKEAKADAVIAFRKKPGFPMPWKHGLLHDTKEAADPMVTDFGVAGFPSLFLIGPDGKLLAKGGDLREENLEKTLEKFLR
ncbi:TlpA family protein disulfide reductase [Mesoterricola silvestris]|uniref:Thioredoxin domain-containing protein n=1 Tax=Mesoterricola silvestris TaxID=2927979 RepID=A0AA48KAI7_9BACT|nr:TlpA disulfide reductase family protein [Mesoterricola silvestris]BDU74150.1 hypothetical protein METEAL_33240 [Mesoterricola silvestris]